MAPQPDNYEEDSDRLPVLAVKEAKGKLFLMQQPVASLFFFFFLRATWLETVCQNYLDARAHHHPTGCFKMKRHRGRREALEEQSRGLK